MRAAATTAAAAATTTAARWVGSLFGFYVQKPLNYLGSSCVLTVSWGSQIQVFFANTYRFCTIAPHLLGKGILGFLQCMFARVCGNHVSRRIYVRNRVED